MDQFTCRFYQSIIRSNYRLTYNYVSDILEGKVNTEDKDLYKMLKCAAELSQKLTERKKRGYDRF